MFVLINAALAQRTHPHLGLVIEKQLPYALDINFNKPTDALNNKFVSIVDETHLQLSKNESKSWSSKPKLVNKAVWDTKLYALSSGLGPIYLAMSLMVKHLV